MTGPGGGSLDPQGPAAQTMAGLWWLMLGLGVAVFVVFAIFLALGLFRRRRPTGGAEARPGNELGGAFNRWIVGAGVVAPLLVIGAVFGATIGAMRRLPVTAPAGALEVEVIGHQWWWEVRYPEAGLTLANEMHIPVGRPVAVRLTSADVIHSFWVPALGGKLDLLPDHANTLVLQADEPGEHRNRCAEYCGLQHTLMGMIVVAEPPERFEAWLAAQRQPAAEPTGAGEIRGRDVFLGACARCHTVAGTTATGVKGPDLTHVASRRTLGAAAVANTTERLVQWVADPHELKRGVAMPAADLSPADLDAVIAYLGTLR
jgi:cytochrome c oxidase subunit II